MTSDLSNHQSSSFLTSFREVPNLNAESGLKALSELTNNLGQKFAKKAIDLFSDVSGATKVIAQDLQKTLRKNPSVTSKAVGGFQTHATQFIISRSPEKTPILNELLSYFQLDAGWDGPDSVRPSKLAIADAFYFIAQYPGEFTLPEPVVYPEGDVGWYWKNNDDILSIVFNGGGRYAYYGVVGGVVVRSPRLQYSDAIPSDLDAAITNI